MGPCNGLWVHGMGVWVHAMGCGCMEWVVCDWNGLYVLGMSSTAWNGLWVSGMGYG